MLPSSLVSRIGRGGLTWGCSSIFTWMKTTHASLCGRLQLFTSPFRSYNVTKAVLPRALQGQVLSPLYPNFNDFWRGFWVSRVVKVFRVLRIFRVLGFLAIREFYGWYLFLFFAAVVVPALWWIRRLKHKTLVDQLFEFWTIFWIAIVLLFDVATFFFRVVQPVESFLAIFISLPNTISWASFCAH